MKRKKTHTQVSIFAGDKFLVTFKNERVGLKYLEREKERERRNGNKPPCLCELILVEKIRSDCLLNFSSHANGCGNKSLNLRI